VTENSGIPHLIPAVSSILQSLCLSVAKINQQALESSEVRAMESNEPPSRAWPKNFPNVTTLVDYKAFKGHTDYEAAKGGDMNAAVRLVHDLMHSDLDDRIISIAKKHPDAILLAIHAVEATGKNEIPQALSEYIGEKAGLEIERDVVQTNVVGHTSAGQNVRLYNRPKFDGSIQKGRNYVLVDDMVTMGGTLGEMRSYVESCGGTVIDMIALSTRSAQNTLVALSDETRHELEITFGIESMDGAYDMTLLIEFLKESGIYGGNYEALTESEARALLHAKGLDEARNRRAKARQA
jgi:predicted amidophosphoribosyltransferase